MPVVIGQFAGSLSDYEISIPVRVNAAGQFVSHSLQHSVDTPPPLTTYSERRRRRSSSYAVADTVDYRVPVNGSSLHVSLEPSWHLLGPGLVVERRRQESRRHGNLTDTTHVISSDVRSRLCHFRGHVRGQPGSKVAISTCSGLVGRRLLHDEQRCNIENFMRCANCWKIA